MIRGNLGEGPLLNEKGELAQAGWATKMTRNYDRAAISASAWKIKEWDYYIVGNCKYALALTVADNSYMSLASASWLDYVNAKYKTASQMKFFTFGKTKMPPSYYEGDVRYNTKNVAINFYKEKNSRRLTCRYKNFWSDLDLEASILLTDFPEDEMVIATPWKENKKAFYFNSKTNCMTATGYVNLGGQSFAFAPEDSMGALDWGRGVWTYKNTWYWASMSAHVNGHKFGFNLGCGFGDRRTGSENMLFYNGAAHKLDEVTFGIPRSADGKDDFMSEWTFKDNEGRLDMTFTPILDRKDKTDFLVLASDQHQVFGKFNGKAVLDDGTAIKITDKIGFAEKVFNKW